MLGNRIQRARKAQALSLRALGEQIGLTHAAIKKYEDDEVIPGSDVLLKLAKVLGVKVEYFFRPSQFTLTSIQYRKHKDMSQLQLETITSKILDQIERRIELENLFPSPPIQAFSLKHSIKKIKREDELESLANQIREEWNLGLEPLPDLIDIFEERGIKVFEIDNQQYRGFDGLSANINDIPIVVIGNQWPGDRQRFTLAHELAHILLGDFGFSQDKLEKFCDHFSGAFILPKQSLTNVLGQHRTSIEARELSLLKQEFGISMASILHRIEEVGIITHNLYRQLRSEFAQHGWLEQEPGEQYPQEKTYIFEQMIFRALAEEYIGESKAAELMNLSLESFRSLRAMEHQDVSIN